MPVFFYPGERNERSRLLGFFNPQLYYLFRFRADKPLEIDVSAGYDFTHKMSNSETIS